MKFLLTLTACLVLLVSSSTAFLQQRANSHRPLLSLNVATSTRIAPSNMTHHHHSSTVLQEFPEVSLQYDHYSGVAIHVQHLKGDFLRDPSTFSKVLESSLELWKMEQRRGIWIHIPKCHGHLISVRLYHSGSVVGYVLACRLLISLTFILLHTTQRTQPSLEAGFDFHHCGDDNTLILKQWLPETPSRLPLGPSHQVGVGALILNDEGNMLVVQEKSGPAAGM